MSGEPLDGVTARQYEERIAELQDELEQTNDGLMALTLELDQHQHHLEELVARRTAQLEATQAELQETNSELLMLTADLDARIAKRTAELRDSNARLERLADYDIVTGLRSRSWITAELERELARASMAGRRMAVLFVDLNEFLVVNRNLGYSAGDEMLGILADRVAGCVPEEALLGRFDGNSFVLVFPDAGDLHALERMAEEILADVAKEAVIQGHRISRTGSVGIAVASRYSSPLSLLREADHALGRAKAQGRSRYFIMDRRHGEDAPILHFELEHELHGALDGRQFVLHYQPQASLTDGLIVGNEALVRWRHPSRGLLAPGYFMDTLEQSGLVVQLGRQILEMACQKLQDLRHEELTISVNVSAVELAESDWPVHLQETMERFDVDPSRLILELTETTMLQLTEDAKYALRRVEQLGLGIHVDDFGTGYASLGLLRQLPVTALKLDRSFVTPLSHPTEQDLDIVRGIAGLAMGLRIDTIAEGVETERQRHLLMEAGWNIGQGYLFGRPAPEPLAQSGFVGAKERSGRSDL